MAGGVTNVAGCKPDITGTTNDGRGLSYTIHNGSLTVTLTDKFGNVFGNVYAAGSTTDPFGNISKRVNSYPTSMSYSYEDAYGTFPLTVASSGQYYYSYPYNFEYTDTTGVQRTITVTWITTFQLQANFGCTFIKEETGSGYYLPTNLAYPDGTNIGIGYEQIGNNYTGRIKSITLRTGGIITYTYGSMNCTSQFPNSLTRQTMDGTWTYTASYLGGNNEASTTTVLDPGKNKTVYYFTGTVGGGTPIPALTQVNTFRNIGTVSSPSYNSTPDESQVTCYNGNTTSCQTATANYPITEKQVITTLSGMSSSSQLVTYYDGGPSAGCAHATSPCYGNVTEVDRYDFGASTPIIKELTTYGSWNGSACVYVGSNIYGKPCDIATVDNASHTITETRYTYNSQGFNTQTQQWTGSTWLTTTFVPKEPLSNHQF